VAVGAAQAVEHVGLPEAMYALAQAAIYLSLAPKSDMAKRAIHAARDYVREQGAGLPPAELAFREAALGRRTGYDNPHRHPGHVNQQEHLPAGHEEARFYLPDDAEATLRERLERIRRARGRES
jgi:putative ATPase